MTTRVCLFASNNFYSLSTRKDRDFVVLMRIAVVSLILSL